MKHLFIVNPMAGKGHAQDVIPLIKEYFKDRNEEYIIEETKGPGDATLIARRYVEKGNYRVYSVGGDGTLNEVLNGMAESDSSLAIIPAGSGNDFIRSLYSSGKNLKDILLETIEGEESQIDFAKVNDRYFINIASIGFDAKVVESTLGFKKLPLISGSLAYVFGIFQTLIKNSKFEVEIETEDIKEKKSIVLIAVGNGRYYGGGFMALPYAKLDDKLLDICLVNQLKRWKILMLLSKYKKGKHESIKEVSLNKVKAFSIKSQQEFPVNIDGELIWAKELNFTLAEKNICVVIPKGNTLRL
ncbi:MAG TPA: diacylglycerol kinase family protein [Clostridiaceae bacterium]